MYSNGKSVPSPFINNFLLSNSFDSFVFVFSSLLSKQLNQLLNKVQIFVTTIFKT